MFPAEVNILQRKIDFFSVFEGSTLTRISKEVNQGRRPQNVLSKANLQ